MKAAYEVRDGKNVVTVIEAEKRRTRPDRISDSQRGGVARRRPAARSPAERLRGAVEAPR